MGDPWDSAPADPFCPHGALAGTCRVCWLAEPDPAVSAAAPTGDRSAGGVPHVLDVFRSWMYLPDPVPVVAILAAVAANRLPGDPVWVLVVGPPSCGKSEMLAAVTGLPDVYPAATLTEPALLSGTPKRETSGDSTGGLLRQIGDRGIILCKDFGSVISMHREQRAAVLAALREIFDGAWTRHLGTDGGRTLHWSGHVGLLAGCTPAIDRHHSVIGAMGERFVLLRLPDADADEQARRALEHAGREGEMRAEMTAAVERLFHRPLGMPGAFDKTNSDRLVQLATLVVRCRSAVERDAYSRDIDDVPQSEAPGRLVLVLGRVLGALRSLHVDEPLCWRTVTRLALDSIPALRRQVLDVLSAHAYPVKTGDTVDMLSLPTSTVRRALEDLTMHGVVIRHRLTGSPDAWSVSDWAAQRLAAIAVPEVSEGSYSIPICSKKTKRERPEAGAS